MKSNKHVLIFIVLLIVAFFAISLSIRVALPYEKVFEGDWVKFTSNDAYYHMRLVDNLVHNFPHLTSFDPYFIYPEGSPVGGVHFFDWLLAVVTWIIGLGAPTQHTINVIGVYYPSVLAALAVVPAFFIGKALFNRWAGVLASGLVAVLPGEFVGRSILGATDNHVGETLFSTVAILFVILAVKEGNLKQLTFSHFKPPDWKIILKPLIYSLLAGLFLGIYLITWQGAMLFVFIITLYLIIQFIINHLRGKPTDYLGIAGFIMFLVALIIFLPLSPHKTFSIATVAAVLIPLVLTGVSRLIAGRNLKPFYYPAALAGIAVIFLGIFYAVAPDTFGMLWGQFQSVFTPGGSTATTTLEMQPFLSPLGKFSTAVAWGNFTTSFFLLSATPPNWLKWLFPGFALVPIVFTIWVWPKQRSAKKYQTLILLSIIVALILVVLFWFITPIKWKICFPGFAFISLVILIWLFFKQPRDKDHHLLFFIWTLVILIATLVQRRFAYYLIINVALLSGYITWQAIRLVGLRRLAERPGKSAAGNKPEVSKTRTKKKQPAARGPGIASVTAVLATIIILFLVFFWNITKAVEVASGTPFAPSDGWEESLHWMKDNTPEPLGDPDAYYKLYDTDYQYPESAYGVTAWWDYGYWITRTAHRIPSANPSQDPRAIQKVAGLFISTDEATAGKIMAELESKYVILDYELATNKFWAIANWTGQSQDKYFQVYYIPSQGALKPVQVFTPDYYRTLVARLYNFNGKAVTNERPVVVTYDEKVSKGVSYRQVTNAQDYPSYQAAQNFIASQTSGNYDIVGVNPFVSPIPLEAVPDYKPVYSSNYNISHSSNATIPEIKIFEYLK